MILTVDGGSTKTDWGFCNDEGLVKIVKTQGINPVHQSHDTITGILKNELLPIMADISVPEIEAVYFYGAGCATESINTEMEHMLAEVFTAAGRISVKSDMLGAARAVCGHEEGIACVLGTGSNSCLYDGHDIIDNVPSLGYILGDEGSSSALGRRLIGDVFKRQLPESVAAQFLERYHLTMEDILENVYRKPMANRYMAEFAPFLNDFRDVPEVHRLITECFSEFFRRNVMNYHRPWLPVNFVGSLAYTYAAELSESAESLGMSVGKIVRSPLMGLVNYYTGR